MVGGIKTTGFAYRLQVTNDYTFIAEYQVGLEVFDVSDPAQPQFAAYYATGGQALDVEVAG